MLIEILLYPVAGFFMKISDDAQDIKNNKILGVIAGLICILAIGYLVITSGDAAAIFLGILVGTILAGKVDRLGHIITLIIFLVILSIFGVPQLGIVSLALCALAAYLDEMGNDSKWVRGRKKIEAFFKYRFALKIVVLILSLGGIIHYLYPGFQIGGLAFFQPETFILFMLFDLAYELAGLSFDTIYNGLERLSGTFR